MNGLLAVASRLQTQRHLSAIRNAFATLFPMIVVGSLCTLFANILCNTNPNYVSLANVPGFGWLGNLKPLFDAATYGTMNFMAIGAVILISVRLAESYGNKDRIVPLVALGSYISLCSTQVVATAKESGETVVVNNVLSQDFTNARGLFVGMIVALISAEIYVRLVQTGKLGIKMPDAVPSNVAKAFNSLIPSCVTVIVISGFGLLFSTITGMTISDAIIKFIQAPLTNILTGLPGYLLMVVIINVLWFFGIHGTQTMQAIYSPIMLAALGENQAAFAAGETIPNIICTPFISNFSTITGAGVTGGLLIAIFLFSKRPDYRTMAKLSLPCAIFNINEPLIFGLPIVMNPVLGIPFILAPLATNSFAYFMTRIGFCGYMVGSVPWTTPFGLMSFLGSSGSIGAAITQVMCVFIAAAIYAPFVMISNRMQEASEAELPAEDVQA